MLKFEMKRKKSGKNLSRIPDPGVKKAPDPGSGSATLIMRISSCLLVGVVGEAGRATLFPVLSRRHSAVPVRRLTTVLALRLAAVLARRLTAVLARRLSAVLARRLTAVGGSVDDLPQADQPVRVRYFVPLAA